jgi:uridylate kinase
MAEKIVVSLGGSLVVPNEIDVGFLADFKSLITKEAALGTQFYIIVGGGKTCRKYNQAAGEISKVSNEDLDWMGIYSCLLNAMLVRVVLSSLAYPKIITDIGELNSEIKESVVMLGPNMPGSSSDLGAVQIAKQIGAKKIVNLSNIDYVYDSDPRINREAKRIEKISWADYRKIIPEEWSPGLNTPFDPIASKIAEEENLEVVVMNGEPIDNMAKYLHNESFPGTIIS